MIRKSICIEAEPWGWADGRLKISLTKLFYSQKKIIGQ